MVRTPEENLSNVYSTIQARAARTSIEPKYKVVVLCVILRSNENVVSADKGSLLQLKIAAIHLKLIGEVVVSLERCDFVLLRGCQSSSEY